MIGSPRRRGLSLRATRVGRGSAGRSESRAMCSAAVRDGGRTPWSAGAKPALRAVRTRDRGDTGVARRAGAEAGVSRSFAGGAVARDARRGAGGRQREAARGAADSSRDSRGARGSSREGDAAGRARAIAGGSAADVGLAAAGVVDWRGGGAT